MDLHPNPKPNNHTHLTLSSTADDEDLDFDFDSACSTPFVSAPSSPRRSSFSTSSPSVPPASFFFSAPSSPSHFLPSPNSADFDFSARFPPPSLNLMSSADELFLNGQIRPHFPQPPNNAPQPESNDPSARDHNLRSRSVHRRSRSLSPLRSNPFLRRQNKNQVQKPDDETEATTTEPSASRSSSSSSSSSAASSASGKISRRWTMFKDLLHRSKSEGRGTTDNRDKFWHSKDKPAAKLWHSKDKPAAKPNNEIENEAKARFPAVNGVERQRARRPATAASAHERHYTANRAHMEEMRRRTFLPYRQGLLGCLGFSSRGYGAMNGLASSLHSVKPR